jgi:hypothetical protein
MYLSWFWCLEKILKRNGWIKEQIENYGLREAGKIKNGLSFSFEPCFYAIGRKVK